MAGQGSGRIVIGVDGERAADAAVRWAARRLRESGETAVVIAVTSRSIPEHDLVEVLDAAHALLSDAAGDDRVEQRLITDAASVPDALIAEAGEDPLVIGHHRNRSLRSALAGWLPLDIVTQATGPVFVIPDDATDREGAVVVGVSRDGSARGAVAFALEEGERTRRPVRLVMAEKRPSPGAALAMTTILEDLRDGLTVPLTGTVAAGSPEGALLAESPAAALIVVGKHAGTPIEEVLVGATGHQLMKATAVPLCVVPPPE
ncbi:MAG TPA: universal stress protein [Pseudolysinimonas sp.]|nr:universal stress protein [Pseudolysinimonas sp.]